MYHNLRPKLAVPKDVNTYTKYNKNLDTVTEKEHFYPTVRPFEDFKASRKATKSNKTYQSVSRDRTKSSRVKQKSSTAPDTLDLTDNTHATMHA